MAQRSHHHVPKFGNWEEENVQYTACFDTAIKEKVVSGIVNPTEPVQNPLFKRSANGIIDYNYSTDTESSHDSTQISGPTSLDISASSEQYLADVEGHHPRPRRLFGTNRSSSSESDQTLTKSSSTSISTQKSISTSETSSTDYSVLNHDRDERQKVTTESCRNVFLATPIRPHKSRVASNPDDDDLSFTSASVPKFGSWNEKDTKSGEGFSVIVNKVKEEKQLIATAKLPPMQPQTSNTSALADQRKKSKRYCCY